MKYKGQELTEITKPQIFDPPKKMLVWDDDFSEPSTRNVWCIAPPSADEAYPVISVGSGFQHCAEIPEEPKPRRATNRELSRWLAEGKGEFTITGDTVYHFNNYNPKEADVLCNENWKIRKWDDLNWHEPTADYMGIE